MVQALLLDFVKSSTIFAHDLNFSIADIFVSSCVFTLIVHMPVCTVADC